MKRALLILAVFAMASGCTPDTYIGFIHQSDEVSLTWKGEQQVVYEPDSCQMAFNDERNEYRVYNDKLAYWFLIRCSEKPADVGQKLEADVSWTGKKANKAYNDLTFTVKKTDNEGRIWLWNDSSRIGIIIQDIQ